MDFGDDRKEQNEVGREKMRRFSPKVVFFSIRFLLIRKKTGTAINKDFSPFPHAYQKEEKVKEFNQRRGLMAGDGLLYFFFRREEHTV